MEGKWSLGVLIGLPIVCLILFVILAVFVAAVVTAIKSTSSYDREGPVMFAVATAAVGLLLTAIFAFGYYPYGDEYHKYVPTEGVVASVTDSFVSLGESTEQRYVVRFEGDRQGYSCNDARCATVEPGEYLIINCIKSWDYQGTDGFNCKWDSREAVPS